MLRVPAECYRQCFQCPRASPSLDCVMLNLMNDRARYLRTFREFALWPAELLNPPADGGGDGRPVLLHTHSSVLCLRAEVSGLASFIGRISAFRREPGVSAYDCCMKESKYA